MICSLCKKRIENYHPDFNQLKIDDDLIVDLCQSCISKFVEWQRTLFAKIYPTTAAKKWAQKVDKIENS